MLRRPTFFGRGRTTNRGAGEEAAPDPTAANTSLVAFSVHAPVPPLDFNEEELSLLDRLYAEGGKAVIGPDKDLERLMVLVPNDQQNFGLTLESFVRHEKDYWRQQNLNARILFLEVKAEQLSLYLKDSSAKGQGRMLSFEELQQRLKLSKAASINNAVQEFLQQNAALKKRWVKVVDTTTTGAASAIAQNNLVLINFTTTDANKLNSPAKEALAAFRVQLEAALKDDLLLAPEGYSLREHLAVLDLASAHEEPEAVTSKQKVLRRHVMATPSLKMSQHYPLYETQLLEHPAAIDEALASARAESERLASQLVTLSETSYSGPEFAAFLTEEQKAGYWQQQQMRDALLIQQALLRALLLHKELCSLLTNDESLMPLRVLAELDTGLCDPMTTTELRFRMLAPLTNLIAQARKKFKEFCELNMGMIPVEDSATASMSWKPITDASAFNNYLDRYANELRKDLSTYLAEWNDWDLADPELLTLNPTQIEALKQVVRKKLEGVESKIQELVNEKHKLEERLLLNQRLKKRLAEEDAYIVKAKATRFNLMLADKLEAYQNARASAVRPEFFYVADAEGRQGTLKDYADPSLLAHYYPGARAEKLAVLIEKGIPPTSHYRRQKSANLLHLALNNKAEDYDDRLVAIVQYLINRGVNPWQFNAVGITPTALVRTLIELSRMKESAWLSQARIIERLCSKATILIEHSEEFRAAQAELVSITPQVRELMLSEEERAVRYEASSSLARMLAPAPVALAPYEDAMCLAQQSLFGLFEVFLGLPQRAPARTNSEFLRRFNELVDELAARPAFQHALKRLQALKVSYEMALAPQVAIVLANTAADTEALHREIAAANERAARAEADAAVAKEDAASTKAELVSVKVNAARADERAAKAEAHADYLQKQFDNLIRHLQHAGISVGADVESESAGVAPRP